MTTLSIQDIQGNPSAWLDRVEEGEYFLVIRDGRPVAELRPVTPVPTEPRPFGLAAGTFTVSDDFDAPLPEDVIRDFEGP
jgi:antitoxin (DNA-binding transcriptional repressor) of toxin-antitoxin stability system